MAGIGCSGKALRTHVAGPGIEVLAPAPIPPSSHWVPWVAVARAPVAGSCPPPWENGTESQASSSPATRGAPHLSDSQVSQTSSGAWGKAEMNKPPGFPGLGRWEPLPPQAPAHRTPSHDQGEALTWLCATKGLHWYRSHQTLGDLLGSCRHSSSNGNGTANDPYGAGVFCRLFSAD